MPLKRSHTNSRWCRSVRIWLFWSDGQHFLTWWWDRHMFAIWNEAIAVLLDLHRMNEITFQPKEVDWLVDGCSQVFSSWPAKNQYSAELGSGILDKQLCIEMEFPHHLTVKLSIALNYWPLLETLYIHTKTVGMDLVCLSCESDIIIKMSSNWRFIKIGWSLVDDFDEHWTFIFGFISAVYGFGRRRINIFHDLFVPAENRSRNHFISRNEGAFTCNVLGMHVIRNKM